MTSVPQRWRVPLAAAGALAAVAAGLPGTLGIALGANPVDWRVPFGLQHAGGFGLRTAIYASGFLLFFGAIVLVSLAVGAVSGTQNLDTDPGNAVLGRGHTGATERDEAAGPAEELKHQRDAATAAARAAEAPSIGEEFTDIPVEGTVLPEKDEEPAEDPGPAGHVPIAEPFFGFLPGAVQLRLAAETGFHALLYTKISIILMAGCGVLLAGSWIPISEFEPVPPGDAAAVLTGLFLLAESAHRYIIFSKGRPSGTLVGYLLYGLAGPLLRPGRR